ncbi:LuxR family two component transcriptional regulator [Streptomyces sp. Amel2xB2]|uniref:response regulator transcription factor n=1 Tax=Streptomyces sp. Amel2xB2 TaxID=1305829 RepID=UPI000DBA963E|nr:response regulator transcription factor [Streptomyces sp. Amel2xB2]RAJ67140.1 LuxR family two component transcriptional regulator [Streptomyces sp. Amel2xB2]
MIRVLLAEDMHMVRGALAALLGLESDLEVVAEVASGDAVLPAALAHRPDVAVLDLQMPGADGVAAARELARSLPECRVMILTAQGRPEALRSALAERVGGFMLKDAPPEQLADAVRRVAAGEHVIDPALAATALTAAPSPLTPRETDVLRLAADGVELAEIARELHLSPGTVRNYLAAVVTKLDARNRLDAVRIAREQGWLTAD